MHEPANLCGCCERSQLARLGENVTEVLEKIPATLKVIRHVRPRYACRVCERIFQAPAPALPIERGKPGPGLLAHVAVSKYCDGLPLFRQSVILARQGVEIDRATLADWIGHVAWWLTPVAELIGRHVMAQPVLWTDDTPIRTLDPGAGRTRLSRLCATRRTRDPMPDRGRQRCSTATRRIAGVNGHARTWPGSAATSMRTPMPGMTPCIGRRA